MARKFETARKSKANHKTDSQIPKQANSSKFKIPKESLDDKRLFRWYNKTGLSNLRWSIFEETKIKNEIWQTNSSSLEFSKKFMCNKWIGWLKGEEKQEVLKIIEGFSARYSDTVEIFRHLATLNAEDVARRLSDIGVTFGFNQSLNEELGLKFDGESKVSDLIVSIERFREVIKSTLHKTPFENCTRHKYRGEMLCNLLKVYVKCIVDAIKKLFIARVVDGKIQTWDTKDPKEVSRSFLKIATTTIIENEAKPSTDPEVIEKAEEEEVVDFEEDE